MNTIEIERLVRRIHSILKGGGDVAMAPKLAEQFKTISASVALRLEQCRSMIEAGAAPQAVQLAETPPNLLDLVTLLEFREADEWRQYCHEKGFPVSEKLNTRAVTMLNECYSRGITPQHPVYGAYREAVFAKNDEAARMALLSIVRLNPADTNAVSELARLDAKILAQRLAKLEQYLVQDEDAALRELQAIEALGFKTKFTNEVWRRGQMLRCKKLLAEGEAQMLNGALSEAITQVDWLAQLKVEYGLEWPDEWNDRFARLQDWSHAESESRQKDEEYHSLLGQLETFIAAREGNVSKRVSIAVLKSDLELLQRNYRRLAKFSRPIPVEFQQRYEKSAARLEQQTNRAVRTRMLLVTTAAAAVVLILATMAVVLMGMRQANALTAELRTACDQHQVRLLASLLKQAQSRLVFATPQLKSAIVAASTEIADQMTPFDKFETGFKSLPTHFESNATIQEMDSVSRAFSSVEQTRIGLAPDLQQETLPKLQDFQSRWVSYCVQMLPVINQQVGEELTKEDVLAKSDKVTEIAQFRSSISEAIPNLEQLSGIISNLDNYATIHPDLVTRCSSMLVQLRQTRVNVDKLQADVDALQQSTNISDYAQLVANLAAIPIQQSVYQQAAKKAKVVNDLKDSPDALSRGLLTGDNLALWNLLKQNQAQDLVPAKVSLSVRQKFMEILRDYAVNGNHHRFDIYLDEQKSQHEIWITSDALQTEEGWHTVQGWKTESPGDCEFGALDYGYFGGRYRLNQKDFVFEINDTSLSDQTSIWEKSGFAQLINPRSMTYNLRPLKVADALCADQDSSPLLRAYLLQALIAIMELQPEESGIIFTPELKDLPTKLSETGSEQLHSGDWFMATRVATMRPGLDKMFKSLKTTSYEDQAKNLLAGIKTAAKDGFIFAGYVKPDGSAYWNSGQPEGVVWGYQQGKDEPGLLYTIHDGQAHLVNQAMPLTPLLLFSGDLSTIVANMGVRNSDPLIKSCLPPLFAASMTSP